MTEAALEHVNITVSDPDATAAWMERVFGWTIRWQGTALSTGYSVHVGSDRGYVALYRAVEAPGARARRYNRVGGFNHLGVVVDDLDATEQKVRAEGFTPRDHADYEPGRRFYFEDSEGLEYEVASYA